jgi:hypothetical protein
MRKLLNKPWVVGLLASFAIGLVAYEGLGLRASAASVRPAVAVEEVDSSEKPEKQGENATENLAAVDMFVAAGSRDPFAARPNPAGMSDKSVESIPATMQTLKLAAIWLQGADSYVAINAQICRVGDAISGASIESVTREGAWLQLPSGRQFLPVGREVTFAAPPKRGPSPMIVVARER